MVGCSQMPAIARSQTRYNQHTRPVGDVHKTYSPRVGTGGRKQLSHFCAIAQNSSRPVGVLGGKASQDCELERHSRPNYPTVVSCLANATPEE